MCAITIPIYRRNPYGFNVFNRLGQKAGIVKIAENKSMGFILWTECI